MRDVLNIWIISQRFAGPGNQTCDLMVQRIRNVPYASSADYWITEIQSF